MNIPWASRVASDMARPQPMATGGREEFHLSAVSYIALFIPSVQKPRVRLQ